MHIEMNLSVLNLLCTRLHELYEICKQYISVPLTKSVDIIFHLKYPPTYPTMALTMELKSTMKSNATLTYLSSIMIDSESSVRTVEMTMSTNLTVEFLKVKENFLNIYFYAAEM